MFCLHYIDKYSFIFTELVTIKVEKLYAYFSTSPVKITLKLLTNNIQKCFMNSLCVQMCRNGNYNRKHSLKNIIVD